MRCSLIVVVAVAVTVALVCCIQLVESKASKIANLPNPLHKTTSKPEVDDIHNEDEQNDDHEVHDEKPQDDKHDDDDDDDDNNHEYQSLAGSSKKCALPGKRCGRNKGEEDHVIKADKLNGKKKNSSKKCSKTHKNRCVENDHDDDDDIIEEDEV